MESSAKITAAVFAAHLRCPTEARLLMLGETPSHTFFSDMRKKISAAQRTKFATADLFGFSEFWRAPNRKRAWFLSIRTPLISKHRKSLQKPSADQRAPNQDTIMFLSFILRGRMRKIRSCPPCVLLLGDRAGDRKPTATERKNRAWLWQAHQNRQISRLSAEGTSGRRRYRQRARRRGAGTGTEQTLPGLRLRATVPGHGHQAGRSELAREHDREGTGQVWGEGDHHDSAAFLWLSAPATTTCEIDPATWPSTD